MPRRSVLRIAPLGLLLVLSGCFQFTSLIRVDPDGSGQVIERAEISEQLMGFIASMDSASAEEGMDINHALLKRRAADMGVRLDSVVASPRGNGYTAYFGFDDVSDLRYTYHEDAVAFDSDEAEAEMQAEMEEADTGDTTEADTLVVTFDFTPPRSGEAAMLRATPTWKTLGGDEPAEPDTTSLDEKRQEIQQMSMFLADAEVGVAIGVRGDIVDITSEPAVGDLDDDAVRLLHLQMGDLTRAAIADTTLLRTFDDSQNPVRSALQYDGYPGATAQQSPLTIRFREAERSMRND